MRHHHDCCDQSKIDSLREFRPAWSKLRDEQASERDKFERLEKSLIGRGVNMVKAYALERDKQ